MIAKKWRAAESIGNKAFQDDEKCTIVTLGIGRDVEAEKKIKTVFPKRCEFFGADPTSDVNRLLFESFGGTFFKGAVAATSGVHDAMLLDDGRFYCNFFSLFNLLCTLRVVRKSYGIDLNFNDYTKPLTLVLQLYTSGKSTFQMANTKRIKSTTSLSRNIWEKMSTKK